MSRPARFLLAPDTLRLEEPILVLGGYGYRNVGDEAILAGLLRLMGSHRRVTVVSRSPAETAALHGVRSVPIASALAELARHRTLILGGGGLFGRDMGLIGRGLPLYGLLASLAGRRVAMLGVGIDRDIPGFAAVLLRRLARRSDPLVVRDRASAALLAGWGIDADEGPDLSAHLPAAPERVGRALLRSAGVDPNGPVVGLCLTAVNGALRQPVVAAVTATMDRMPDVQFCYVPMSQHPFVPAHNDLLLARELQRARPRLSVLDGSHDPSAIISVFSSLSAAISMRYHGLLFARRANLPVLPIIYAEKCQTWLRQHDIEAVEPDPDALTARLRSALGQARAA